MSTFPKYLLKNRSKGFFQQLTSCSLRPASPSLFVANYAIPKEEEEAHIYDYQLATVLPANLLKHGLICEFIMGKTISSRYQRIS